MTEELREELERMRCNFIGIITNVGNGFFTAATARAQSAIDRINEVLGDKTCAACAQTFRLDFDGQLICGSCAHFDTRDALESSPQGERE